MCEQAEVYLPKSSNDIKVKHVACNVFARLGCWQPHVKWDFPIEHNSGVFNTWLFKCKLKIVLPTNFLLIFYLSSYGSISHLVSSFDFPKARTHGRLRTQISTWHLISQGSLCSGIIRNYAVRYTGYWMRWTRAFPEPCAQHHANILLQQAVWPLQSQHHALILKPDPDVQTLQNWTRIQRDTE